MGICLQAIFGSKIDQNKPDQLLLSQIIDTIDLQYNTKNDTNFAYYPHFFYMEKILDQYLRSEKNDKSSDAPKEVQIMAQKEQLISKLFKQKESLSAYLREIQLSINKQQSQSDGQFSNSIKKLKAADDKIRTTKIEQALTGQACFVKFQIQEFTFKIDIFKITIQLHQNSDSINTKQKANNSNLKRTNNAKRKVIGYFQTKYAINSTVKSSMATIQNSKNNQSKNINQQQQPIQRVILPFHYYQFSCPINSTIVIKAQSRDIQCAQNTLSASINVTDLTQNLVILQKINFKLGLTNIGVMGVRAECLMNFASQRRKIVQLLSLRKFQITQCLQDDRKGWQGLFSQKMSERSKNDTQLMSQYENPYVA